MNRYRCRAIAAGLLILFATISSLIAQFSPWKGTITTEGGVTVAKNPKEPIHKEPILSLKEDFAISGAGATGDYAFSYPRDIAVDKDGNIYVLDMSFQLFLSEERGSDVSQFFIFSFPVLSL